MGNVAYSLYTLEPKGSLNALSGKASRQGALLRLEDGGYYGYSDCYSWPELGDLPLMEQLENLKKQIFSPVTARALHYAWLDLQARQANQPLLTDQSEVTSQYLITDLLRLSTSDLNTIRSSGFDTLKVKLGIALDKECRMLDQVLAYFPFRLRFDFNTSLTAKGFEHFLQQNSHLLAYTDFIEDPFPFDLSLWSNFQSCYGIQLAADSAVTQAKGHPEAAAVLVCKPAIHDWKAIVSNGQKTVITSYLGHPVGQVIASYEASLIEDLYSAGIITHCGYHQNAYSEQFQLSAAKLRFPKAHGWGFEGLLEQQAWQSL